MAGSCAICCESLNRSTRKLVTCNYCQHEACLACCKTYILQSVQEPHCMNCRVPWNIDFITNTFTRVFFKTEYRKHRENVLFEREKALFPETQQRIRASHLEEEYTMMMRVSDMYTGMKRTNDANVYRVKAEGLLEELRTIDPNARILNGQGGGAPDDERRVSRAMCKCIQETCRGFVMSNNWKCGLCNIKVCSACLKEEVDGHECLDEDKQTRDLLLKNTKPCPNCAVMINKIDGCDQMWCVMCQTPFSWKTGEVVSGRIHNPEYYAYMRRTGRDLPREEDRVAAPCGAGVLVEYGPFRKRVMASGHGDVLCNIHRMILHIEAIEIPRINDKINTTAALYALRCKYLLGDLSMDEFKKEVYMTEKNRDKNIALRNTLNLIVQQGIETLNFLYTNNVDMVVYIAQFEELRKFCMESFKTVKSIYGSSMFIPESWYVLHRM